MKKIILITSIFFLMLFLGGCSSDENKRIYGKYKYDKLLYVWVASSNTPKFLNEKNAATKYIIKKDEFKIITSKKEIEIEIKNPIYKKEEMKDDLVKMYEDSMFDLVSISQYKEKYRYTIYNKHEMPIYYLYSLDDELWIAYISGNDIKYLVKLK